MFGFELVHVQVENIGNVCEIGGVVEILGKV